jgi:hypothetical protein
MVIASRSQDQDRDHEARSPSAGVVRANTDQPLPPDPDYSGLKVAPPILDWFAGGMEKLMNAVSWLLEQLP